MTLDFKGLAHPVMVLVEGTRLDKGKQYRKRTTILEQRTTILDKERQYWTKDNNTEKGQQYWTKDNNTGKEQKQYWTKDKTQQRKATINL